MGSVRIVGIDEYLLSLNFDVATKLHRDSEKRERYKMLHYNSSDSTSD